ncbi:amidohydrolase 2 [Dendrothele bispora CBS 962.96]|uniref:Amidohydrolase 2 n=1 Tax=Dendrothele bispora (strain CBS 962.96) TaxID=1314807 RepID=A0A4S8LV05_DENBC|nr:amidohydrolase 2 [Dendrothele bispora CBS 962.96]
MKNFPSVVLLINITFCAARVWNDTGVGTIVFEEAWTIPGIPGGPTTAGQPVSELQANLLDIHNQRLTQMDENGIDFMILSCASPCIQGISDPETAAEMAVNVNNQLADQIANNTLRFGGFAALSMHNATEAALELNRTIKELGFLGALVNDYQQSGPDNDTLIYYDQPGFDVFWQTVTDLDVPVYFHPRDNIPLIQNLQYSHAPLLIGAVQEFAATLSTHILGLCTNGVFDRFPNLKVIVGHLGERIPSDLVRIDTRKASHHLLFTFLHVTLSPSTYSPGLRVQNPNGLPMQRNVSSYFQTNIFETTSGNFATDLLLFHNITIGLDRILYSIDYPFVDIPDGTTFVNGLVDVLTPEELLALKRGRAIDLFKLND